MVRHRLRQSSNLLGPSGLISMEDASIFHRIHIGNHTPGAAIFQKGVRDKEKIEDEFLQNDESGNLPRWEYYREIMGFERSAARSEEGRVGKECGSTCRYRGSRKHEKKKKKTA